jgi:hypothetical protein
MINAILKANEEGYKISKISISEALFKKSGTIVSGLFSLFSGFTNLTIWADNKTAVILKIEETK